MKGGRDSLGDPEVKMSGRPSPDRYRSLQRQEATDQSLQRQEATEAGSGLPAGHCWLKIALPSFMDLIRFNYYHGDGKLENPSGFMERFIIHLPQ
jgi:hypothetical protein